MSIRLLPGACLPLVGLFIFLTGCEPAGPSPDPAGMASVETPAPEPAPASESSGSASTSRSTAPRGALGNVRGPEDAPVRIVEYSDFHCPYSRRVAGVLDQLFERHPGLIRWEYRAFPLPFHRSAPLAHEAALIAGEWGLFWEMRDKIYANPSFLDSASLSKYAREIGIDPESYRLVQESGSFFQDVLEQGRRGREQGVRATPTIFINEYRVDGARSLEVFDYHVRRCLDLPASIPEGIDPAILMSDPELDHPFSTGEESSPVAVKVFLDLESPLGQRLAPRLSRLVERHGERVRFVIKAIPTGLYPDSELTHRTALLAHEAGLDIWEFWNRRSRLGGRFDLETARRILAPMGLLGEALDSVIQRLEAGEPGGIVDADAAMAAALDIRGGPVLLLGAERLDGSRGIERLDEILSSAEPREFVASSLAKLRGSGTREPGSGEGCHLEGQPEDSLDEGLATGPTDEGLVDIFDFGTIPRGAVIEGTFQLKNPTDRRLALDRLIVPVTVELSELDPGVEPGKTLTFQARYFSGWSEGPVQVYFELRTADPGSRRFRYLFTGTVSTEVTLQPPSGIVARAIEGDPLEAEGQVVFAGSGAVGLELIESSVEGLEVTVEPVEAGRRYRVVTRQRRAREEGVEAGQILLKTTHPRFELLAFRYQSEVLPETVVSPRIIVVDPAHVLPDEQGRRVSSHWLRLKNTRDLRLRLTGHRLPRPDIVVQPAVTELEMDHRILVRVPVDGIVEETSLPIRLLLLDEGAGKPREVTVTVIVQGGS